MTWTRTRSLAPILAAALATASLSSSALAEDCGDVDAQGTCLDAQTLLWCADEELMTVLCPQGEVCSAHEAFDGGYGCVPPEDTPCGDIPAEGECTSAGNVVWCLETGTLSLKECGDESVCGWDNVNDWYDCLPAASMMAGDGGPGGGAEDNGAPPEDGMGPGGDAGSGDSEPWAEDDAGPSPEDDTSPTEEGADSAPSPTPEVTPGSRDDEALSSSGDGDPSAGCSGAGAPIQTLWLLALALFPCRRRLGSTGA